MFPVDLDQWKRYVPQSLQLFLGIISSQPCAHLLLLTECQYIYRKTRQNQTTFGPVSTLKQREGLKLAKCWIMLMFRYYFYNWFWRHKLSLPILARDTSILSDWKMGSGPNLKSLVTVWHKVPTGIIYWNYYHTELEKLRIRSETTF